MLSKISVIVPFYKDVNTIKACIESILLQTYTNYELILVDDCGDDGSIDLINQIIAANSNIEIRVLHHQYNRGQSAARNTGLANANGDYIFFVDADDTISSNCLEMHVNRLEKFDADYTDANYAVLNGRQSTMYTYVDDIVEQPKLAQYAFESKIHYAAHNKLYKKNFLDDNSIRFIEGIIYEDVVWAIHLSLVGRKIVTIADTTYNYIVRSNSTTSAQTPDRQCFQYESWMRVFDYILELGNRFVDKDLKSLMYRWLTRYKFRVSLKLIISCLPYKTQKYFYNQLNNQEILQNSKGVLRVVNSLPFLLFKILFIIPYRCGVLILKH